MGEVNKSNMTLVHKDAEDDVLIFNGRGPLPASLHEDTVLAAHLPPGDLEFLRQHYVPCEESGGNRDGVTYRLKSVLPRIKATAVKEKQAASRNLGFLSLYYKEESGWFILNAGYIDEQHELELLREFGHREQHIRGAQRARLSGILDSIAGLDRPKIYRATMFNDAKNYFFYRKNHEHVPGVMIVEVARQAMYAHFYHYSGIQKHEVSLSILSMNCDFKNYANANYPVDVSIEDVAGESSGQKYENIQRLEKRATFYQSGKLFAVISLQYYLIKIALFKHMRVAEFPPTHRFLPLKNVAATILLTDERGASFECALNDISLRGFNVSFAGKPEIGARQRFDFVLFVRDEGYIAGAAALAWQTASASRLVAGLTITAITSTMEKRLKECIKNFTHVNTAREIV